MRLKSLDLSGASLAVPFESRPPPAGAAHRLGHQQINLNIVLAEPDARLDPGLKPARVIADSIGGVF